MIEVIETEEKFKALEPIWRKLEQGAKMRVFQTFDWCWFGWQNYEKTASTNSSLWILRWYQEGRTEQVIFPFFITGKGELRFIMDVHSDTNNAVYYEDTNYHYAFKEAAEEILKNPAVKTVNLMKLNGDSTALNYFAVHLRGSLAYKDNAYSYIKVPQSEDFIKNALVHMRSKDKADVKAVNRKSAACTLRIISRSKGDDYPQADIDRLVAGMLKEASRTEFFFPKSLQNFIKSIYEVGAADIAMLERDGEIIAINFLPKKEDRYLSWIFLYSDPKSSTALYCRLMDELGRINPFTLDFGVGVYLYKIGTFRPELAATFSLRYAKGYWGQFKMMKGMNWRIIKDFLKAHGFGGH